MVLSRKSGMNFVAGESVNNDSISIILNSTPMDEAINLLVRAAGLSYEIIGNSVLIAEKGKLQDEVGLSSYVIELKYANATEVAKMLGDLTKNIKIDEGGNRLIVYTSPRVINEVERIVKSIDHPHILVVLETRLIEVSIDDAEKYGINWGGFSPISQNIIHQGEFELNNWTQSSTALKLSLDALISNGDAQLLMNSKLMTTNNRQAHLLIGEVVPYTIQNVSLQTSGGGETVEEKEVGVKVSMTPHINEENQVTLSVAPEVSTIVAFIGKNQDLPLTRVRKTETTVRVEDGQTIFIAGLLSEEESEVEDRLPVLGDIPLLGALFTHKSKKMKKSNLIIEITPKIISGPNEYISVEEKQAENQKESQAMAKEMKAEIEPVDSNTEMPNE
jgi:type II secretory pathway component GspD/PulD (secretin)